MGNMIKKKRLLLTSFGLTSKLGRKLIEEELKKDGDLSDKRIFLFHEPYYSIEPMLINSLLNCGFIRENIIFSGEQKSNQDILGVDYIYITEGNTFDILALIRERRLDVLIKVAVENGATYIGASAGSVIAGDTIEEAYLFDRNQAGVMDFSGLGLLKGIVIPHFTKEQLEQYLSNNAETMEKYGIVYAVADDEILVIEI